MPLLVPALVLLTATNPFSHVKILALVRSTKNSNPTPLGSGFKLITPDVEDLLSTEDAGQMKHTLSAICTPEKLTQYRLDPPRGGTQHALVIVTAKTDASFVVESVQLLSSEEAAQAKQSLLKVLHMAMHIHGRDRKHSLEWNETFFTSSIQRMISSSDTRSLLRCCAQILLASLLGPSIVGRMVGVHQKAFFRLNG